MEDKEKQYFDEEMKSKIDPIENWPIKKLKKEAEDDGQGNDQSLVIDDIGIE